MKILGIWDGHDSGAALIQDNEILFAINEERLTRRKLEVHFPFHAIKKCLEYTGTAKEEITTVAFSTTDVSKTLTRYFPQLKEEYYQVRRRKKISGTRPAFTKKIKYKITESSSNLISKHLSKSYVTQKCNKLGLRDFDIAVIDHHASHAACAAYCSGLDNSLVVTMDGLGDGLSGTVSTFTNGILERKISLPAKHSVGIFFEHVTNILNMRELEDEGKVMALANFAYPIDDNMNPMLDLLYTDGLEIRLAHSSLQIYKKLKSIFWQFPSEQFAFMAQRTLEKTALEFITNCLAHYGMRNLSLAGGVFSNVKLNRLLRVHENIDQCYVFPHMGDGGLAIGAALSANYDRCHVSQIHLPDVYLGPEYKDEDILEAVRGNQLKYAKVGNIIERVAELLCDGEIVFWFQGRMELGPRSLGSRSILALPNSTAIKDELNLKLKKRVWYQPFCPSMLFEDAGIVLEDFNGKVDPFMTMAYMVKPEYHKEMEGVINVDGSCRPQIIHRDSCILGQLLTEIKQINGSGILLNTSMNIHGEPLVCSPDDAIRMLKHSGNRYLAIGNYVIEQA